MERVVISGANRGLGLEFCRQYLENGDGVVALTRTASLSAELLDLSRSYSERLVIVKLDVTAFSAVEAFGRDMSPLPVHVLINNAGAIGPETHKGESGQNFDTLTAEVAERLFRTNALGAVMLTKALVPSLQLASNPRAIVLGSTVGLARETFGDYYAYRMSKAAAHAGFATLAIDLRKHGIAASVVCPGWVNTDLGGPAAPLSARESVRGMRNIIEGMTQGIHDKMLVWDGSEVAL